MQRILSAPALTIVSDIGWTCPLATNVLSARLDIIDKEGHTDRSYLINPFEQGFPAQQGNVAALTFASKPDRWLVGDTVVASDDGVPPRWNFRYYVLYMGEHLDAEKRIVGTFAPIGEAWFAELPEYPDCYFYFIMPIKVNGVKDDVYDIETTDHPLCGYGSISKQTVDSLFKPRA